jgi:hypothetical protein
MIVFWMDNCYESIAKVKTFLSQILQMEQIWTVFSNKAVQICSICKICDKKGSLLFAIYEMAHRTVL